MGYNITGLIWVQVYVLLAPDTTRLLGVAYNSLRRLKNDIALGIRQRKVHINN